MKLDMTKLDSFDYIYEIPPETAEDKLAKIYFRGSRDWFWDFTHKMPEGSLKISFEEMYEFLVRIMVKWEGFYDSSRNLQIPFSKERALLILKTFEIVPQDKMAEILMTVWNKVSDREELLKNLLGGPTTLDGPSQDGLKPVLPTDTTQSTVAKVVRKKPVKV